MRRISISSYIRLLLVYSFFYIITATENATFNYLTDEDIAPKIGRLKRAPYFRQPPPETLEATIVHGKISITVKWYQVRRHLVNENVPVYTAHLNNWGVGHALKRDAMKEVGNIIFYHSSTHHSVLMYIERKDAVYSVVDRSYAISAVSFERLSRPLVVNGRTVIALPHPPHLPRISPDIFLQFLDRYMNNRPLKPPKPTKVTIAENPEDIQFKNFYVEILVFIAYDIYKFVKDHIKAILINYIIHFVAVDMLFADLPTEDFKVSLNIAGFIIEAEDGVFSKVTNNSALNYNNGGFIDTTNLLKSFERYPAELSFPFTKDSYDLIYFSTGRYLRADGNRIRGLSSGMRDVFEERRLNYGKSFVPMAVVQARDPVSSFCVSAHEIARGIGISQTDPVDDGLTVNNAQCYGIMQNSKYHCARCMQWSDESMDQLKTFMRENRNRCFLLNEPRSLYPPDTAVLSLSPCSQCKCFGYGSYGKENDMQCPLYVPPDQCWMPLECRKGSESKIESTIMPLDGTLCGENGICWDERCTRLKLDSTSI